MKIPVKILYGQEADTYHKSVNGVSWGYPLDKVTITDLPEVLSTKYDWDE